MTLMMREIFPLDSPIPAIADTMSSNERPASANDFCDCVVSSAADCVRSVLLLAIALISSPDADVSSSDAACSDAPCASDCADEEICEAAADTCCAPSD